MTARDGGPAASQGMLTIGALSRATGIPAETLRTWEHRYGFPVPVRKPSGHRVYPLSVLPRLRRVAEVLARGHRAGEVVAASQGDLEALLKATAGPAAGRSRAAVPPAGASADEAVEDPSLAEGLDAVSAFDGHRLSSLLQSWWALLGPLDFLQLRAAPFSHAVGEAWQRGRLEVRHEHFLSERLQDFLRSARIPFEERATGPLVILATLPGEQHGIGLQMAALLLSVAGFRILNLGTEVPVAQIASLAADLDAQVVALSVSEATKGRGSAARIAGLRRLLPARAALVVGGAGSPVGSKGVVTLRTLADLDAWGRRFLSAGAVG